MIKRFCGVLVLLALVACVRKDEISYDSIEGCWYLYAAYRIDGNTDILPIARTLGYDCISDMELLAGADTFAITAAGLCADLAARGTYVMSVDTIAAYYDNGEPISFCFDNGVLSTIVNIKVLGDVELRFQKKK